jgi:tetratricopeptide (TPR) repeat protein
MEVYRLLNFHPPISKVSAMKLYLLKINFMRLLFPVLFILFSSSLFAQTMPLEMSNFYDELAMQDFEQKIKTIDNAIKKHPKEPWYYWMKASMFDMMGGLEEVVECYNKCLEIDSTFSGAHASLGRFYLDSESEMFDIDKAMYHTRKAISFEPDNAQYYIDLGEIYYARQEYYLAIEQANIALNMPDSDAMPACRLIVISLNAQNDQVELKDYLLKFDFTEFGGFMDPDFDMLLGNLYESYGDKEKACRSYNFAADVYRFGESDVPVYILEKTDACE